MPLLNRSRPCAGIALCLALFLPLAVAAKPGVVLRVAVSKTPSSLPVLRLVEAGIPGGGARVEIAVWSQPEILLAMVQSGDYSLFSLPLTLAARMHNRGLDVVISNVNTWGGVHLVTSDATLEDWRGLKGRELYLPPRGSPPEALARFFLAGAGLNPDSDVAIRHAAITEQAQLLRTGRIAYGVLVEPQVTAALTGALGLRRALDFGDEWRKTGGGRLPNIAFGGLASFYRDHPELAECFEKAYADAVAWVIDNPEAAGRLAEEHLGLNAQLIVRAMPNLGLSYEPVAAAAADLDAYFRVLFDYSPDLIGGRLPDATLYRR